MGTYVLKCEMLTSAGLRETFALFEDPYNLAKLTPPWLNFEVTSPGKVTMREAAEITYKIKWLGLPLKWKTMIRSYEPPRLFVDEQVAGPYTLWRHRHTFEETKDGTFVADEVLYALPFGLLGGMAHSVLVRGQLLAIFNYRQLRIAQLLGGTATQIREPFVAAIKA